MAEATDTIKEVFTSGAPSLGSFSWALYVGMALIGLVIGFFFWKYLKSKKKNWNLKIRVRQPDTQTGSLSVDPAIIRGRRVTLKEGAKYILLEKPLIGKRLLPLLNYYTKPGIYDLVISEDNRVFLIDKIIGFNESRKALKVEVRYPGVEYAMDEASRKFDKVLEADRKTDILGIVKAAAAAVIAIVILVIAIVGVQGWVEAKQIDAQKTSAEARILEQQERILLIVEEQTQAMDRVTDKLVNQIT